MRRYEAPLLFAIFLDMVGFGMAFPDIQTRAARYLTEVGVARPGFIIGLLLSSYFVVQILASPRWGALSDRIGRKPVLLICTALSSLSMLAYAFVSNWEGLLISRLFAGLAAANVVVAQAYIADSSTEDERPKAMGRVGAVLSLGLVGGPAIGGQLADWGDQHFGSGNYLMGIVAAAASALACFWITIGLPNRPPTEARRPGARRAIDLSLLRDLPSLRRIFLISAMGWLSLACLEGTFGRLINLKLGLGPSEFGWIFSYESLLGAGVSWYLLTWITSRVGETSLLRGGYLLQGIGLAITPFAPTLGFLFLASTLYALGAGVANPTINSLCSQATPPERQGEMFGLLQGTRSLGFILGPLVGGTLFDWVPELPYYLAGGVCLIASILVPKTAAALKKATI